ncbi:respiratory burst oxidase homolog protein A isoform X2 [Selaginella moellendorffii]|uniref:respiratory burst oxidase homolog protein A isoform X2 n=1 Tax=Selaginella moellendorffii TaxID=88036 RepID=UPI000D1CEDFA|nr:respiratory burst oxidase homolog protein A isoform X2 [Selaginella moellendorffii]|eukprot:XP_024518421.1 respiratory burst oxidase homolog protein A isoform X2 [Selaginella moellendorffii]
MSGMEEELESFGDCKGADDHREGSKRHLLELTIDIDPDHRSVTLVDDPSQSRAPRSSPRGLALIRQLSWLSAGQASAKSTPDRSPISLRDAIASSPFVLRKDLWSKSKQRLLNSGTKHALQGLRFISTTNSQWRAVESRFWKLASDQGLLSRADFGLCIGMQDSKEFAGELFDALARRKLKHRQRVEWISYDELRDFWLQISDQNFDSRMQIFFDMCDKDLDGLISEAEVKEVIMLSASENKLSKLKERAEEYAAMIMEELDPQRRGYIELWQLESLIQGTTGIGNYGQILVQPRMFCGSGLIRGICYVLIEHWQRLWVLGLWLLAVVCLFSWKFVQYKNQSSFLVAGYCICVAKGAAETLKLNMALILLPVCRNSITWLRSTSVVGSLIPFDDNINFHKIIGGAIFIGVVLHGGVHLTCDFPRLANSPREQFMAAGLAGDFGNRQPTYWELVKSIEGVTGIAMVLIMCVAFVLASGRSRRNLVKLPWPLHRLTGFNAFWYSHHLFIIVYTMLVLHSMFLFLKHDWVDKTAWMYLLLPTLLYMFERTFSGLRAGYSTVQILKAAIYPGNVLSLDMTKPPGFKYQSGMYIFIKCPSISPFEWHPFSITSAPSDDFVSVHIRISGDWTGEMGKIFSEVCEPPVGNKSGPLKAEYLFGLQSRFPKLLIDGPYGAPAQDYKKYDVLLLIGLGIGATPFISILKDILNNIKTTEPKVRRSEMKPLKKESSFRKINGPSNAYFYWLTKEQGSFEWFRGVMNEIAELDHSALIEMHNYLTSVYAEDDARSALITMVQALHLEKNGVDILSGTRVRTHFAKPNWRKVFGNLASLHPNARIGVFFCGSKILARELDSLAREYSHNQATKFDFHKENF